MKLIDKRTSEVRRRLRDLTRRGAQVRQVEEAPLPGAVPADRQEATRDGQAVDRLTEDQDGQEEDPLAEDLEGLQDRRGPREATPLAQDHPEVVRRRLPGRLEDLPFRSGPLQVSLEDHQEDHQEAVTRTPVAGITSSNAPQCWSPA